jgi:uncharacterized protein involved in copper resistance
MKLATFITVLLWLISSTVSLAGAQNAVMGEDCHEAHAAAMSIDHGDMHDGMDHHMMDHTSGTDESHDTQPAHQCDHDCCDGACLCKASCGSLTAMTPSSLFAANISIHSSASVSPEKGIKDPPTYLLDPPPRLIV